MGHAATELATRLDASRFTAVDDPANIQAPLCLSCLVIGVASQAPSPSWNVGTTRLNTCTESMPRFVEVHREEDVHETESSTAVETRKPPNCWKPLLCMTHFLFSFHRLARVRSWCSFIPADFSLTVVLCSEHRGFKFGQDGSVAHSRLSRRGDHC